MPRVHAFITVLDRIEQLIPGERFIYYRGHLAIDTHPRLSTLTENQRIGLRYIQAYMLAIGTDGAARGRFRIGRHRLYVPGRIGTLGQRRISEGLYEYFFERGRGGADLLPHFAEERGAA